LRKYFKTSRGGFGVFVVFPRRKEKSFEVHKPKINGAASTISGEILKGVLSCGLNI
jgi:hypothetical protein